MPDEQRDNGRGNYLLQVEGIHRWFGGLHALDGVDLNLVEGNVHAVIGPNGSGKSTLLNLITGHDKPSSGRIRFKGVEITGQSYHRVVRRGIAKSYQVTSIFRSLSVLENVRVASQIRREPYACWRRAASMRDVHRGAEAIVEQVGLQALAQREAGQLAHGDRRRLDIAIALATKPRLLLLDEPTAGMSPRETEDTVELMRSLRHDITLLLVEHKMDVIFSVADRVSVLHLGRKIAEGAPAQVRVNKLVQDVYLGVEA